MSKRKRALELVQLNPGKIDWRVITEGVVGRRSEGARGTPQKSRMRGSPGGRDEAEAHGVGGRLSGEGTASATDQASPARSLKLGDGGSAHGHHWLLTEDQGQVVDRVSDGTCDRYCEADAAIDDNFPGGHLVILVTPSCFATQGRCLCRASVVLVPWLWVSSPFTFQGRLVGRGGGDDAGHLLLFN